jgi:hypothetical protein
MCALKSPWYGHGLAFECQRCRSCCRGEPGYVWVDDAEIDALAGRLGQPRDEFVREHCRTVGGRVSLRERSDGDCVLLGPDGCLVYEARPRQCRSFPFWPEHVASAAAWKRLGRVCPGVDRGRVRSPGEIRAVLKRD